MRIVLVGLPYVGKTTIGEQLAASLGVLFIDTDREIEKQDPKRRTCREIFLQEGEPFFRQLEQQVIMQAQPVQKYVMAVGGGALLNPKIAEHLKSQGELIYLRAHPKWLFTRLREDIPAYMPPTATITDWESIASTRMPLYEKYAKISFSVDQLEPNQLLQQLVRFCGG